MKINNHSSHLTEFLNPEILRAKIARATKLLREKSDEFDSIAVTGMSGMLYGPTLSMFLEKPLLIVRKKGDSTHSSTCVESYYHPEEWGRILIVDDLIQSGDTITSIINTLQNELEDRGIPFMDGAGVVGVFTTQQPVDNFSEVWDTLVKYYDLKDFGNVANER